jgi:hypothetical protein
MVIGPARGSHLNLPSAATSVLQQAQAQSIVTGFSTCHFLSPEFCVPINSSNFLQGTFAVAAVRIPSVAASSPPEVETS